MDNVIFGPCTITHGATTIGYTSGGGSFSILEEENVLVGNTYEVERIAYGVEGTINKFQFVSSTIESSMEYADANVLTFTGPDFVITIHNAKLYHPKSMSIGTMSATPYTLRFTGSLDSEGKLITISEV
jgi:hypothetical protein